MVVRKRPVLVLTLPVLAGTLLLPAAPARSQYRVGMPPPAAGRPVCQQAQRGGMLAPAGYRRMEGPNCSPSRGMLMLQQAQQQNAQLAFALDQARQQNAELARSLEEARQENARLTATLDQHQQRKALVANDEQQQIRQLTLALDQEKRQTAQLRVTLYQEQNNRMERRLAGRP